MAAAIAWISANAGALAATAAVGSGLMSMAQGSQQADSFRFQAELAGIQAQERSINYKREELNATRAANEIMDRQRRSNAAVVARAAAMGIMPFQGSPLDLQKYNDLKAGEELDIAKMNREAAGLGAKNALIAGDLQAKELRFAASSAESMGMMKGLFSIAGGLAGFAKLGGAGAPTVESLGGKTGGFSYYGM